MNSLIERHQAYRRKVMAREREFLHRLASEGQSPDAMYIGCADSRVVPELLTSSSPGEIFVVRNVANLVPPLEHADASVGAALEYAVEHLKVQHLIVCGHYGCGGVKGMMEDHPDFSRMPSLKEWLAPIKPTVDAARLPNPDAWWRAAVERNVVKQLMNLLSFPLVAEAWESDRLEIHGWVYDLFNLDLSVYDEVSDQFAVAQQLLET